MRNRTLIALVVAATVVVAACSGSGSGLTNRTWHLTAITTKKPAFQGDVPAADQSKYTIEFKSDGTYNAKADCNQTSGTYTTASDHSLTMAPGPTTLVACPAGSLSDEYIQGLTQPSSYVITGGQLTLSLDDGDGTAEFK